MEASERISQLQQHLDDILAQREDGLLSKLMSGILIELQDLHRLMDETNGKYRLLAENIGVGIWAFDADADTTFVNHRLAEMLGYAADEMMGRPLFSFMDERNITFARQYFERITRGIKERHDFEFIKKDGKRICTSLETSPIFDDVGSFQGAVACVCDITERRRIEDALRGSEEMHKLLFENANDGILLNGLTADGFPDKFIQANDIACKMLGYSKEELFQLTPRDIQAGGINDILSEREEMLSLKRILFEKVLIAKDGRRIPAEIHFTLFDLHGKPVVLAILRDITERKKMEAALRNSEKLFRAIYERAPLGIALTDSRTGQFIQVNEKFCEISGYTREELLELNFQSITHPDDQQASIDEMKRLIDGKTRLFDIEKRYLRKDGSTIWVSLTIMPMWQEGEAPCYHIALAEDITGRKKIEEELRESKDRLDKIINSIADPMFVKNRQHRYVLVNDAHCNFTGRTREEMICKTSHDLFAEKEADVFWQKDEELFETGRENVNEELITDPQGVTHTVITKKTLYKDKAGNKFLVGIVREITDRKRMEEEIRRSRDDLEMRVRERTEELEAANAALKNSKDYLDKIINSIGDPIFVKDRQHRLVLVNDAACRLFGRPREHIIGRTGYELFGTKDMADISWHKDEEVFKTGEENTNEETNTYAPGVTRTVLVKKTLYTDSAGNKFLVGVTRDITDRKLAEDELKGAKEAAESAVRSKSEFLANMSHEIRTPLNAVIGLTGLLLNADLTPEQRDYVETIRSSGNSLLSIINDILDFSKIEGGKMELENQPFDLRDCVEESLDLVAADASQKGLKLSFLIDDRIPAAVLGDVTRLRQVLANLLSNAVKFTDRGAVDVSVVGNPVENSRFEIQFTIKDTGIGIPEDKLGRLFQSFSQVDSSMTRKYGGTGLGLAISKRLVEMMGGRVWVESEAGVGSAFHFSILAQSASLKQTHIETSLEKPQDRDSIILRKPLRILLAEDNAVNQKVALQMLKRLGYGADVAANGLEVLQALERQPYDVVLMDIQMPEMNGIDAAKRIRELWPDGPKIIAITAYALEGDKEKCIQAGMDDYISKPIQVEELQSALMKLISA